MNQQQNRPLLLDPVTYRGLTLKNRIVVAPMAMYSSNEGFVDDFHLVHLGRFALGGAGLVFTEATAVSRDARMTHGCNGLWLDAQVGGLKRITDFLHRFGAAAGIQLGHSGRKASTRRPWHGGRSLDNDDFVEKRETSWEPVSSTNEPFDVDLPTPRALQDEDLALIIEDYKRATLRAVEAGFDVLEIHCAHGYLLHSFLSPLNNTRDDRWGGDLQGRMRLPLAVVAAARDVWPKSRPLFVRISAVDGRDIGWSIEDSVHFARELVTRGVDVIDCSSGGMKLERGNQLVARSPGFHVPLAARIKQEAAVPTIAVGLIREAQHAESILRENHADLVAIAREALFDPNWALRASLSLEGDDAWGLWPEQYALWLRRRGLKSA